MKLSVLPLLIMACVAIVISLFLLIYKEGPLGKFARSYAVATLLLAVTWTIQSVFMNVHNSIQARFIYSIELPTVFIMEISVIKAFIVSFNMRPPRWYSLLWILGIVFLITSVWFHREIYPLLQQVPDGYFFASPKFDIGFSILKLAVYGGTFLGFLCVVAAGLKRQDNRVRWQYGLVVIVYAACMINDSIVLQSHRTLYPTSWIPAAILFILLWRETRRQVQAFFAHVNLDKFTGAYSRTYGEEFLAECLRTQNVGLFYADIDNFKDINDEYGHQVGDMVLKSIIKIIEPMMNEPNIAVRLGGDEFLFVFPGAKPSDEIPLRKQLESLFRNIPLVGVHNSFEAPIFVSLGWAYAKKGDAPEDVINNADLAMYHAKSANKASRDA